MNKKRRSVPGIRHYDGPAGGWGALKATAIAVRTQMDTFDAPATLLRTNQPDGFDCPGCAWPDKEHKSTFQFCENGAKAVTWEATSKRVTPAFLAENSVSLLLAKSDFELEGYGRLTHPLRYDRDGDTFRPVEWDAAFQRIGEVLRGLEPDQVEFYTSGRASRIRHQQLPRLLKYVSRGHQRRFAPFDWHRERDRLAGRLRQDGAGDLHRP